MPYNRVKLAEMTTTNDEYLDLDEIAKRLEVTKRTIERLVEEYAKKLKRSKRRNGRKFLYLWADMLMCAKIHTKLERDKTPSPSIKKQYMKLQQIEEMKRENARLILEKEKDRATISSLLEHNVRLQVENDLLKRDTGPF